MQAPTVARSAAKVPAVFPPLSKQDQAGIAALLVFLREQARQPAEEGEPASVTEALKPENLTAFEGLLAALPYLRSLLPADRQEALDAEDTAFARVTELMPEVNALMTDAAGLGWGAEKMELLQQLHQLSGELLLRQEDHERLRGERMRHAPRVSAGD